MNSNSEPKQHILFIGPDPKSNINAIGGTVTFFKQVFNYGVFVIFSVLVGMTAFLRVSSGCKDFIILKILA